MKTNYMQNTFNLLGEERILGLLEEGFKLKSLNNNTPYLVKYD